MFIVVTVILVQSQASDALEVETLLVLFTLNHVSVITFRESTYAVNMNECMLPPTFLSSLLCSLMLHRHKKDRHP